MFKGGDCLHIETNIGEGGRVQTHLHFVLLDPEAITGMTIIVDLETLDSERQDHTTILKKGEHPFIDRGSFVNYSRAKIRSVDQLNALVKSLKARRGDPLDPGIYERVRSGIMKSPRTPMEVSEFCFDRLLNEAKRGGA